MEDLVDAEEQEAALRIQKVQRKRHAAEKSASRSGTKTSTLRSECKANISNGAEAKGKDKERKKSASRSGTKSGKKVKDVDQKAEALLDKAEMGDSNKEPKDEEEAALKIQKIQRKRTEKSARRSGTKSESA